jgi:hypothetical protein
LASVIRIRPALIQVKGLAVRSFLFRSFFNLSVPMSVVGIPLANESPFILGTMDIISEG